MNKTTAKIGVCLIFLLVLFSACQGDSEADLSRFSEDFVTYEVDPETQNLKMYWKNNAGENFENANNLKKHLENKGEKLLFSVNGGMYNKEQEPQGLYIENGVVLSKLDTNTVGYGNFYLQPNGVFFLTDNKKALITTTNNFKPSNNILFATQSGPMLLVDGVYNPLFGKNSTNLNIRNGVGILPNGHPFFVQSVNEVNLYEFAKVFKDKGCENALYLDGYVSKTYLPEKKWEQLDGDFAVIIAVSN